MVAVRLRDTNLVPIVWQASHMVGYALTAVLGLASGVMFYLAVELSSHRCYLYNAALIVQEVSREQNQTLLSDDRVWYMSSNCYDTFSFSLQVCISSVVWMSMFLVFGRGGSSVTEFDHSKYFSDMVGQWQVVFFASCFNFWYFIYSIVISLQFTNGYLLFVSTLLYLPVDNYFRNRFEKIEKPYYIRTIVLLWCQSCLCTFNFLLIFFRCAMGVDFDVDFDYDDGDNNEPVAGPSNQTKIKSMQPMILYDDIKLDYVAVGV
eukprot:XP_016663236.1 PREDICTED: uncharacterized protein LOC107884829 [Acyrthosiphon pisum]